MNRKNTSLLLSALLCFAGSGKATADERPVLLAHDRIRVAADVPATQAQRMKSDLEFLGALQPQDDSALRQLMGIAGNLNAQALESWLAERVQYVVREEFDPAVETSILQPEFPFEHPGVLPELNSPKSPPTPAAGTPPSASLGFSGATIVMQNLSSGMYLEAKSKASLIGARIAGVGIVPVSSPRTGIIQIGQGMFLPSMQRSIPGAAIESAPYSIFRLMVLFHEARHSDGNGRSAGFLHTYCPLGHDYEGEASCDLARNGAYALGGKLMANLVRSCSGCGTAEKEALKLEILDDYNRVLKEGPRYIMQAHDLVACQKIARDREPVTPEDHAYCQGLLAKKIEMVQASDWDPAPEGSRAGTPHR